MLWIRTAANVSNQLNLNWVCKFKYSWSWCSAHLTRQQVCHHQQSCRLSSPQRRVVCLKRLMYPVRAFHRAAKPQRANRVAVLIKRYTSSCLCNGTAQQHQATETTPSHQTIIRIFIQLKAHLKSETSIAGLFFFFFFQSKKFKSYLFQTQTNFNSSTQGEFIQKCVEKVVLLDGLHSGSVGSG